MDFEKHQNEGKGFWFFHYKKKKSIIENLTAKDKKVWNVKDFNTSEMFSLHGTYVIFWDLGAKYIDG